ncbi:MAG: Gldg family protein [Bdellovibrionales bacterium]|nr:Gldg family protein [Bdellovibrionales bacterium]
MNANQEQKSRKLSFGVNSVFITVVVVSIIGLINFLGKQYPKRLDLTKNKIHTFSDQTVKVMKGLKEPVEATLYGDFGSREKFRPIFENYKKASNLFKYQTVDPNKEPTRAKAAGIKKMDTLILSYQGKTAKVEEITEEKVTNELIRLTKDGKPTICSVIGHGESSLSDNSANGYSVAKKGLEDQSYLIKELTLSQEAKIPAECAALVMMGANKALFPAEVKMLETYLQEGGRMVVGLDATLNGQDQNKELKAILESYGVITKSALIVDPVSKMVGVDATVPIMATFNKDTALGKDFQGQCYFPFSRPLELVNPAPEGLKTNWVAKTTPNAFGETDFSALSKGSAKKDPIDPAGPLVSAIQVNGKKKDSKSPRETRLVVFGSGQFPSNQFSRFGANVDLFLNAISWAVEDESMISIRAKEDEGSTLELSQTQAIVIFWTCVILIPLLISVFGIVIWVRRKKL